VSFFLILVHRDVTPHQTIHANTTATARACHVEFVCVCRTSLCLFVCVHVCCVDYFFLLFSHNERELVTVIKKYILQVLSNSFRTLVCEVEYYVCECIVICSCHVMLLLLLLLLLRHDGSYMIYFFLFAPAS
jgi:hypothetical protein